VLALSLNTPTQMARTVSRIGRKSHTQPSIVCKLAALAQVALWERSAAERLSERFQPCLILAESDESMSKRFQPCLILAETD